MALQRWDRCGELTALRRAMDQLFDESFARTPGLRGGAEGAVPLDVIETDDALLVKASLPGVDPENVDISVHRNTLTISGELRGEGRYYHRERWYGRFQRQVMLPSDVDTNACDASFEHGVLTVRLPKSEQARPRRISVRGSQAAPPAIESE